MSEETDYNILRCLDQQPFKLVVATGEFAMRGIDYRSEKFTMTEVIAKSFSCKVQARQGLDRVGRFGDSCRRIRFQDVEMVDEKQEAEAETKLFRYIETTLKTVKIN